MGSIGKFTFTNDGLSKGDNFDSFDEVWIDKSSIGVDDHEKNNHNFLATARKNKLAKNAVVQLANMGYFLYEHTSGVSKFAKLNDGDKFKKLFHDPDVKSFENIFYKLQIPEGISSGFRLLVVFSSIADLPFNANISRRMFFPNYQSISKYIPKNTIVLRIADVGAVLGSFYLNNNFDDNFQSKIQSLIEKIRLEYVIDSNDIVLYGTSKGATGALFHGGSLGYKTVAVDPIVADDHYINNLNDMHFVLGTFPRTKRDIFFSSDYRIAAPSLVHVVTSPHSEQYSIVSDFLSRNPSVNSYVVSNPEILGHTTIAPNTLTLVTCLINSLLYGFQYSNRLVTVY